jgi:hypothetical protein
MALLIFFYVNFPRTVVAEGSQLIPTYSDGTALRLRKALG